MIRIVVTCTLCMLCLAALSSADDRLLDSWRIYPIGMDTYDMCAADFDGNGSLDIAAVSRTDSVVVLLNNGGGTFGDAASYWTAGMTYSVDTADFDGDGDVDLVVGVSHSIASTAVMLNNGDGTFRRPMFFGVKGNCEVVRSADFDNDGLPDIATSVYNTSSSRIYVLFNQGDSTFSQPLELTWIYRTYTLIVEDLNNDGVADIAAIDSRYEKAWVILNDGAGHFYPAAYYGVGTRPTYLAASDFDGDGDIDLAVSGTDWQIVVFLYNDGRGAFPSHPTLNVGGEVRGLTSGDFDRDGDSDLIICRYPSPFKMLINDSSGNFHDSAVYSERFPQVLAADFTGDGNPDLAAVGWGTKHIAILPNDGHGIFPRLPTYPISGYGEGIAAADIDNDEDQDLAVVDLTADEAIVFHNTGEGRFSGRMVYATGETPSSVVMNDIDNDGDIDMVVANRGSSTVSVFANSGDGSFVPTGDIIVGQHLESVAEADFDRDGDIDLAAPCSYRYDSLGISHTDSVHILLNSGEGDFTPGGVYGGGPFPQKSVGADFDGDGDVDLAVTNAYDSMTVLFNDSGRFERSGTYPVGRNPVGIDAGDCDGDGDIDIVTANASDYNLTLLINDGGGEFVPTTIEIAWMNLSDCRFVDIDNDGDNDLAMVFYSPGVSGTGIIINDGAGIFRKPIYFGGGGSALVPADLDGDGDLDLAVTGREAMSIIFNLNDFVSDADYDDPPPLPQYPMLYQNRPNPFNPATAIAYRVTKQSHVNLTVYNILGQKVIVLVDDTRSPGEYSVVWNGRDASGRPMASGVYVYRLTVGDAVLSRQMILLK